MFRCPKFNPNRDIQAVRPGLAIDLSKALSDGVVKDTGIEPDFNGLDEVSTIGRRVSDSFEALDALKRVRKPNSVSKPSNPPKGEQE